jgi:hypothetical protein
MDKKEEFKEFAKVHPELINYLNNHPDMNWQKFYEIYDIYGQDERSWSPYIKDITKPITATDSIKGIGDFINNIDVNSIQEHIKTAQKALGVIEELTTKGAEKVITPKGPTTPRPINKFFGD